MLLRGIVMAAMLLGAIVGLPLGIFESADWLWAYPLLALGFFVLELVLAFVYLLIVCKGVDMDAEQEIDDPRYRKIVELYADSIIPMVRVNIITKGLNKVPKEGRFLLVCNHLNDSDPALLLHFFRNSQLAFISKKENSTMFIVGKIMHKILCQMINRENDREALKTILKCIQLIKDDEVSVAVFPEGGIKENNLLNPFRPGVFKIAQKANVPIVVCTLWGSQNVFKNFAKLKPTDVDLHLVGVIPAEELKGVTAVDISNRVHAMMAADLGEERVYHEQNT